MELKLLKEKIFDGHFIYSETEKSERKIDLRKQLENSIRILLNVAPHKEKFFFPETFKILENSIKVATPENGKNPAFGFESIEIYASNLYLHPWRKEYRTIRIYCGYYQHEVAANLVEPELLFRRMGYNQINSEILQISNSLCAENLRNVSRDSITAYVECQIIKDIHYELTAKGLPLSYEKIYNYRKNNFLKASDILYAYQAGFRDDKMQFKPPDYANLSFGNNMPNYPPSMITNSNSAFFNGSYQLQQPTPQYQTSCSNNKCDYNVPNGGMDYHRSVSTNGYHNMPPIPLPPKPQSQSTTRSDISAYNVSGTRSAIPDAYRYEPNIPELSMPEPMPTPYLMSQMPLHQQFVPHPYYGHMAAPIPQSHHPMHTQMYAYPPNHPSPMIYTTNHHATNLLETHFDVTPHTDYNDLSAQFNDFGLQKSYNYNAPSKHPYNLSNYNTTNHKSSMNNHNDLDYDHSTITDKTISSRNSDFDSYDEHHSNVKPPKKPINKKDDEGVGSAEQWHNLYTNYKQKQDLPDDDRSFEALSLDPAKKSLSSQSRINITSNKHNNEFNNNIVASSNTNNNHSKLLNGGVKVKKPSVTTNSIAAISLPQQQWNCASCTYLNSSEVRICVMCSKSRDPKECSQTVGVK